jgi:hypothetical protein
MPSRLAGMLTREHKKQRAGEILSGPLRLMIDWDGPSGGRGARCPRFRRGCRAVWHLRLAMSETQKPGDSYRPLAACVVHQLEKLFRGGVADWPSSLDILVILMSSLFLQRYMRALSDKHSSLRDEENSTWPSQFRRSMRCGHSKLRRAT